MIITHNSRSRNHGNQLAHDSCKCRGDFRAGPAETCALFCSVPVVSSVSFLHGLVTRPFLAWAVSVSDRREREPLGRPSLGANNMIALPFIIVAIFVSAPVIAAGIVAVASRREDSGRTLGDPPPSPVDAAARRIVGFYASGIDWIGSEDGSHAPVHKKHDGVR